MQYNSIHVTAPVSCQVLECVQIPTEEYASYQNVIDFKERTVKWNGRRSQQLNPWLQLLELLVLPLLKLCCHFSCGLCCC